MLAGTNPVRIRRLKEEDMEIFQERYPGIELKDLESLLKEPMEANRAFILDHHYFEQFLKMINGKGVCAYATRTILIADESSYETIIPVAIELSLPEDSDGGRSKFLVEGNCSPVLWELAKFHVASNDAAYHQLVSHWLHTHAVVEPFIIATRRRLSVIHPIHRLLDPHFKDTLHINALARAIFLNAGGILETLLFTGEYSMELSSHLYKEWRFDKQALPEDLLERLVILESIRIEWIHFL
ncbi:hypothetical protein Goklo_013421 [Gossypium klotzschianum]|uniref:Lipoxygenase domain-containing protein n=1 Tax=Gossypium klotzschianum TaxID=34286 RepID=A0A7J8U479_9ROSI|nr:hypothetical protein [Gossypium klotzschianum]